MPRGIDTIEWTAQDDMMVMMYYSGRFTQDEVAKHFGITQQSLSRKLKSPQAQELLLMAKEKLRENLMSQVEDQLDLASQAAIKVIRRTLEADIAPTHKAKSNQDKVAVAVLRGKGFLREEGDKGGGGFQVSSDQFDRLMKALEKSDAARTVDPFAAPTVDAEVIEEDVVEAEP